MTQPATNMVLIKKGQFRNFNIQNEVFPMIRPPKKMRLGLYITVDGTGKVGFPQKKFKIKIDGGNAIEYNPCEPRKNVLRSDEKIIKDMRRSFSVLDDMVDAVINGVIRGMVVSGAPGVGKSFTVEGAIETAQKIADMELNTVAKYGVIKGAATPIGLYQMLYRYSSPGSVLVLDDADTMLYEETSLNLLKAALDTGRKRVLGWNAESHALEKKDIPNSFEFNGAVIFITNLKFDETRGKIGQHLEAIMSRCHYLNLKIHTLREKFLRCKQIISDGMLNSYHFENGEEDEIIQFVGTHRGELRELSLRTIIKIADLRRMSDEKWKLYAKTTCLKH